MAGNLNAGSIIYEVDMDTTKLLAARREVDAALNGLSGNMGRLEASVTRTERSVNSMQSSFSSLTGVAKGLAAALSIQQVTEWGNEWVTVNNKLANSVRSTEQLADVTQRVFDISQNTMSGLQATATLYGRLERATRSAGTSTEDLIKLTSTINKGLVVSGATTEEASSTMIQLSQALASGVLRGEEFNSISENGSRLAVALADSLGVTIGQLRAMAAQGKLTTEVVVNGLLQQSDKIAKEFSNTAMTMGQAVNIATNNIVKFVGESSTVSTGIKAFNTGIISLSQNLDIISTALVALTAVMGSRFAGALAMSTAAKIKDTAATIASAKASAVAAKDAELEAGSKLRLAEVEKAAAVQTLQLAQGRLATLKATNASVVSEVRLAEAEASSIRTTVAQIESEKALEVQRMKSQITEQGRIATATRMAQLQQASVVLNQRLASAEVATAQARATAITTAEAQVSSARLATADATGIATAANGAYKASQEATVIATRAASTSLGLLRSAMGLVGGPAGVAMIAGAAIFYFWQQAQQAKQEAVSFADGVDRLTDSLKAMSNTSLRGTIADANTALRGQQDVVSDLKSEIAALTKERDEAEASGRKYGTTIEQGNGLLQRAAQLTDQINQKQRDLESTESKLENTTKLRDDAQVTLSNNMLAAMGIHDKLIERGTTLERVQGAVAKAFGTTADEINRANQAGQGYNPKSMQVSPATPKGDEAILNLEQQNELLKIQDERLRAVTKAGMEQAKVTSNPNQIEAAKRLAGENYDLQKSEDARKKAASEAESQAKRSATSSESVAQKLAKLKEQSDLVAESTQELTREKAILRAQESLGKSATEEQIRLAGEYGAKIFDTAKAVRDLAQAEQGRKYATQEIAAAKVMPDALSGAVEDPEAEINLREKQKLDALAKYQALDLQNAQLYEEAKTAIQRQAANERKQIAVNEANMQAQAISSIVGSVSQGFDGLANLAAGAAGRSSGAYQAMFALSKGFAVAQAGLNLQLALSQALADPTKLTTGQKIAGYAQIAAAGGSLLSTIGSISYGGGREHGGPVSGSSMYRVGEGGKPEIFKASNGSQYMIPGDNGKVISNSDLGGMSSGAGGISMTFQFDIQTTGGIDEATQKQMARMMQTVAIRTIQDQQRPRGLLSKTK
ncbi:MULTISPECIES: tape measure protein [Pantoea]|uniref:tape measure protein n=1 Tax=Pantoea TaxID=53335 RepID=UPI00259163A6|nr:MULTISPECIES: tape measure protein [Pantoea]